MLPRRTIIAADRSCLRAAKPSDRAQWKTNLAIAVIRIAAAAGSIRAVAAAGRVLAFATNRVGRAAAVAARHQVIWTASDAAASIAAATETAKTQRPHCSKANENPCHPPMASPDTTIATRRRHIQFCGRSSASQHRAPGKVAPDILGALP